MTKTLQALMLVGVFQLIFRGLDLVSGDPVPHSNSVDLGGVEGPLWGSACLIAGVTIFVGVWKKLPRLSVLGSLGAFSIHFMFAVLVVDDTAFAHPPDDWRILTDYLGMSAAWLIIAYAISFRHGVYMILRRRFERSGLD